MKQKNCLKGLRKLALAFVFVMLMAGSSFALDVYLTAQEFTYQDTNAAAPYYSPILSGITMWGFAQCTDGTFATCGPASIPGPTVTATEGETVNIHLRNSLPAQGTRGSATTYTSIVIPGQTPSLTPGAYPTWTDGTIGPRMNTAQRVRSFTTETAVAGTAVYTWTSVKTGTYLYQSGTHPAVQVQMGLYGGLVVYPATAGQAYNNPSTAFDNEVVLLFSEIDPELHFSVQSGRYGTPPPSPPATSLRGQRTSTVDYRPNYFLINGQPYWPGLSPIPAGNTNQTLLMRFLNAGLLEKTPTLQNQYMTLIAEDGNLFPYSKQQYSLLLPAGKCADALLSTPASAGYIAVYDRTLNLTNAAASPGGDLVYLQIDSGAGIAPAATVTLTVAKDGNGSGTVTAVSSPGGISCGTVCSQAYLTGTEIRLGAMANAGSQFTAWSGGGCSGTGDCIVTLNESTTVTATFGIAATYSRITILAPVKDEVVPSGSSYLIRWGAPAKAVTFRVQYSLNGRKWTTIVDGVSGNSTLWSVPVPPSTNTKSFVRVIGYNAKGKKVGTGKSGKFTISVP